MNTTNRPTEVFFRTAKNGQRRAYRVSRQQFRTFPMAADLADMMIANETAIEINGPQGEMRSIFCPSFWRPVR